jgi:hypothetical protein
MATDFEAYAALLRQLDRIAKAPMTRQERELRARTVLGENVKLSDLLAATASETLSWNAEKASEHGAEVSLWLRAIDVAGLRTSDSVGDLLDRMHRADGIAQMLRAGYAAGVDPLGGRTWRARG